MTPAGLQDGDANGDSDGVAGASTSLEDGLREPEKQFFCSTCGKDCTRVRYHNTKSATNPAQGKAAATGKFDVCPTCYLEARFPGSTQASEYTKLENEKYTPIPDRDRPWSDAETLLLLEGLEMFDEDWASVAEHVGTRTREQCVLKFLQLEIEDKYLEAESTTDKGGNLAYLNGGRVPFSQADNPVMSVVGFLASAVDPSVAAAAAGRTVNEMRSAMRGRLERGEPNPTADAAPATTAAAPSEAASTSLNPDEPTLKSEDTMDVDGPAEPSSTALATTESASNPSPDPATIALALAAARSAALASHEERQMASLLTTATNLQLQKLELKLQQFAEMEASTLR